MELRFDTSWRSKCGSGLGGTFDDAVNFATVRVGLLHERVYVWVLGKSSASACSWQRFKLGDDGGRCIGTVAWMRERQHAVRLVGPGLAEMLTQIPGAL